jgi:hypothetical protein
MEKKINRSTKSIEYEIVNQILISEICFDICKFISEIEESKRSGRGSDFVPFYFNLNFSKGIISLHSLLLSNSPDELSIKNYVIRHRWDLPSVNVSEFEMEVSSISKSFKNVLPVSLRHKIAVHVDQEFRHADFTSAYIVPDSIAKYDSVVKELKKAFFNFTNWTENDYPYGRILEQSKSVIGKVIGQSDSKYQL